MADLDIRHFRRHWYQVIRHTGVQHLALIVVDAVLIERCPDALDYAAADLLVDQTRIDDGATILDHPVFEQLDEAGLDIDLEPASLDAVGEGEGIGARRVMACRHQFWPDSIRQLVATEIHGLAQIGERHALGSSAGVDYHAVSDIQACRGRLQQRPRDLQNIRAQRPPGLQRCLAGDTGTARRPRTAAVGRGVGVAGDDADFPNRHADGARRDLRDHRLGALALLGDASCTGDPAGRIHANGAAVLRGDMRPANAVEGRAGIGHLDHRSEPDTAINSGLAKRRLFAPQPVIIHHREYLREALLVRQLLKSETARGSIGIGVIGDQIATAKFCRVHAQLAGCRIDQPLGHAKRDRVADRAVLAHHILVLEHDAAVRAVVGEIVGPPGQVHDLVGLNPAGARIDRIGADAGQIVDLDGGYAVLTVHC